MDKLTSHLHDEHPENVAIQLIPNKKQPVKGARYLGGMWTWEKFDDYKTKLARQGKAFDIGILAKSLFVLDADNQDMIHYLESTFPALKTVPMESTRKGAHYFMLRTPLCNQLGLYDKASCFMSLESPGQVLNIDLKTLSKSQPFKDGYSTPGLITVCPSEGKEHSCKAFNLKMTVCGHCVTVRV